MDLAIRVGRSCEICSTTFKATYREQRTCSRKCGWALRHANHPPKPKPGPHKIRCTSCGRQFETKASHAKYCSSQCRINGSGARVLDLYALACQIGAAGARWRELLVGYLKERDGTRCGICKQPIRFELKAGPRGHPSGNGPSVDHVIPRSQGGHDGLDNLRLTHWRCNRERRSAGGNEQLMLFG